MLLNAQTKMRNTATHGRVANLPKELEDATVAAEESILCCRLVAKVIARTDCVKNIARRQVVAPRHLGLACLTTWEWYRAEA